MSRSMKDSGIEWIGEIPSTWTDALLSSILSERKNKNKGMQEDNLLSLSYGNIVRKNINTNDGLLPASFEGYNIIEDGDIVLRLTDLQNDHRSLRTGLCKERGIITSAYTTLKQDSDKHDSRFLHYYLHCFDLCKGFYGMGDGVRQGLNYDGIRKIPMLIPNEGEENEIADFIDNQIEKVDTLIVNQQKQIEKLKQYKQSLITEVVTKGLNPDVETKDSGLDWVGEIPANWKVTRIKYLLDDSEFGIKCGPFGSALTGKVIDDGEIVIYGQWNIVNGDFSIRRNTISGRDYSALASYQVQPKDILVSMMGTIGRCAIVPDTISQGIMDSHVIKIRLNDSILPEFFCYEYDKNNSSVVLEHYNRKKKGFIMDGLNTNIIKNAVFVLPPINEQEKIVSFLDEKCSKFDSLIAIKEKKIEKLNQYKKSIIYEYVTGKKEA